jgi:hypothetical protein
MRAGASATLSAVLRVLMEGASRCPCNEASAIPYPVSSVVSTDFLGGSAPEGTRGRY